MSQKKLGRGLGDLGLTELLTEMNTAVTTAPAPENELQALQQLGSLGVNEVHPGRYQPRKHFSEEALDELAQSISQQGIIQPIVVRHMNDGYEIIAGERRWRAAQRAGLEQIPAIVKDISDEAAVAMSLIENIQRRDLNAMEEASALQRLVDEFQLTHQEVAAAVGKSRETVSNLLRLQKLNSDVKALVERGHLEMGHARALLALEGGQQSELANVVVARGLSVRQTEEMVRRLQSPEAVIKKAQELEEELEIIQTRLAAMLDTKVAIKSNANGKGQIVIHYRSKSQLEELMELLN